MKNITKVVSDNRILNTLDKGVDVSLDKLRAEIQSKNPYEQIRSFVKSFYYMKDMAKQNPSEYQEWFDDVKEIWKKLSNLISAWKITIEDDDLKFNGVSALKNMKLLNSKEYSPYKILKQLHAIEDYKRIVRYFQNIKQEKAIDKQINISNEETGKEANKVIDQMKYLHKKGYVTDVFLIHADNVASNIIQNYVRVLSGVEGGRDSSEIIVNAYLEIERKKDLYKDNAEDKIKITSKELQNANNVKNSKIDNILKNANIEDDIKRGDKPIDVYTEINTMKPLDAYRFFIEKMTEDKKLIFNALLKYASIGIKNLPESAKNVLTDITKNISNKQALTIIKNAVESKKYIYSYGSVIGGLTPALLKKVETILN
jgi:hypothetical protein